MSEYLEAFSPFGVQLDENQLQQLEIYSRLLIEWNARMNLTSVIEPKQIVSRHFADSLACVRVTGNLDGQRLIDVGSGAGFPGLVLKIAFPQLSLMLSESVGKKVTFLRHVVAELGLVDVVVDVRRAEMLGRDPLFREQFDWAVARAVAPMPVLAEYLMPFVRVGGQILAMKGRKGLGEMVSAETAIQILGASKAIATPYQIEADDQPFYLITAEKITATPGRYPRRTGIPSKRPL